MGYHAPTMCVVFPIIGPVKNHRISTTSGNGTAFTILMAFTVFVMIAVSAVTMSSCQHPDFSSLLDAGDPHSADTTAITIHVDDRWAGATNRRTNE